MHHRILIMSGILLCPSLLHAQTTASPPPLQSPPSHYTPAQPAWDGTVAQPVGASIDRWSARPLAIEGHMGFGTPVGLAGAAIDYSPSRWFGGGVGVGAGVAGPQTAAMARFRV